MPDGSESSHVLTLERRAAGVAFARVFAAAICLHSLTLLMEIGVSDQNLVRGFGGMLASGLFFAIWAAAAPRGAAFVVLVVVVLGLLSVVVGSFAIYRDQGAVVMIPFSIVAIPSEVFAVSFAWRARPLARSYRQVRRRLRSARHDDRIRAGGGM